MNRFHLITTELDLLSQIIFTKIHDCIGRIYVQSHPEALNTCVL